LVEHVLGKDGVTSSILVLGFPEHKVVEIKEDEDGESEV
jgi:hypothetical protein